MSIDETTQQLNSNAASAQRQRLEHYFHEHGKITTLQAQIKLDIVCPAARVYELRHIHDLNIVTNWRTDHTAQGKPHRVAEYVLLSGKYNEVHHEL
ncbi:helix-turn-helix domain-containing protein [Marinicella marina]|uniref:helix-turn-helix domain-containing protein n=1 Tax=Marinicella marina TaxID=2996016 RepID=UPI0024BD5420|nr:helix-turn-helix domain-containing protein [Marinicella marina]MDJ1138748.1 helix-turn-helix domain-containing protein [Marinicella marina]